MSSYLPLVNPHQHDSTHNRRFALFFLDNLRLFERAFKSRLSFLNSILTIVVLQRIFECHRTGGVSRRSCLSEMIKSLSADKMERAHRPWEMQHCHRDTLELCAKSPDRALESLTVILFRLDCLPSLL